MKVVAFIRQIPRQLLDTQPLGPGHDTPGVGESLVARPDCIFLVDLVRLVNAHDVGNDIVLERQGAGLGRRRDQFLAGAGTRNQRVGAGVVDAVDTVRTAADPGVRCRDIGRFADAVGANLAAKRQRPGGLVLAPVIDVVEFPRFITGLDPCRARATASAVAQRGHLRGIDADAAEKVVGALRRSVTAANHDQHIPDQPIDTFVLSSVITQCGDVAGLGDERKRPVSSERRLDID